MKYKIDQKYHCDHCQKECIYWEWQTRIVYCQEWEHFYQQIACSRECYDILEDAWLNPKVNTCQVCKKRISESDTYEYRWFHSCSPCFEKLQERVEEKRAEVAQVVEHSSYSQRNGEWHNWGYKNMKVDSGGNPITKITEPQILQDYEKWIL